MPAGPVCSKWRIGPSHKTWRRIPPASSQAGRRGAATGFAPPFAAQRWTCIEGGRPRARFQPPRATPVTLCLRWIRGSGILASHGQKRFVRPSPPVSDRPRSGVWVPFPLRLDHNLEGWTTFYLSKTSEKGLFPTQGKKITHELEGGFSSFALNTHILGWAHARRKSDQIWDDLELCKSWSKICQTIGHP